MFSQDDTTAEIAAVAARLVVDEGQDYAAAKRSAIRQLNLPARTPLPDNERLEAAVREHIAVFCADTQPAELQALRELALRWMDRLDAFRPYLGGAVWHGTATRLTDIHMHLFCDDPKQAEWALLDQRVEYHPGSATDWRGRSIDALTIRARCEALSQWVLIHLMVHDLDDLKGALKPDAQGRKPRGDRQALLRRMAVEAGGAP
ncbi:MAG: hypothetical protein KF871_12295 [Hydrogenophaga sp.]|uniref:hypothetical protein n=1 Tax=Hydrogenophaga sp. TaxID=1904254 RepID=UPI001DA6CDBE|nr:hypothetical protein [Hydrogenophaga sp.]MBX3610666.1 hypothetical protein [Hydrogenophaga sp.]